jgi:hypothetical protein
MRKVSNNLLNLLSQNIAEPILLLDIGNSTSLINQKLTSCSFSLIVEGVLYTPSVEITSINLPKTSETIDKETYTIKLSDPNSFYKNYFDIGLTNVPVTLRAIFVNTSSQNFLGANGVIYPPEEIITSINDSIIIYKGFINNAEYLIDPVVNESQLSINVVSVLASLDNKEIYRTTKTFIKSKNKNDSSFDFVFENSENISLKWGKI